MAEQLVDALRLQEASWNARPLLRELYVGWFEQVCAALSRVEGRSIELGSGIATLQRTCPRVEPTDVEPTPWVSEVVDAEALPYGNRTLANLVLVDVFHHLARPARFLDEAAASSSSIRTALQPRRAPTSASTTSEPTSSLRRSTMTCRSLTSRLRPTRHGRRSPSSATPTSSPSGGLRSESSSAVALRWSLIHSRAASLVVRSFPPSSDEG
jgi:hypothetical protein